MEEQGLLKKRKGFAAMDEYRRRQIASMGGKASQAAGTGHKFTTDTGRMAGAKGGRAKLPGLVQKVRI
jgi:general stress protein YciG